jgi:hypothetical protein
MLKKIIEKIFKRKRLAEQEKIIKGQAEIIDLLTTGETMHLDQHERRMILRAIELPPFREMIDAPKTKHYVRVVFRKLREKLKVSIKADPVVDRMDIPKEPVEVKEDDETRGADE